jgi:hydroxyacylglutathione hydrolase
MITVQKFVVNPLQENSYLLSDETGECVIIDAGFFSRDEEEAVVQFIGKNRLKPVKLVNTHCHFDHIMGIEFLRKKFSIPFECHAGDALWLKWASDQSILFGIKMAGVSPADGFISEANPVRFGDSTLQVLEVPGHSPGHVVFYSAENSFLIAGDALFYGSIGRTDLPGGNYSVLIKNLRDKILTLPPSTKVWCGHGTETSIGFEKKNNPFLI